MKSLARSFALLITVSAALFLAGCDATLPKAAPQAAAQPPLLPATQAPKSLVEMQHELDLKALEIEDKRTMALIKFADESKSPFAMGLVSGMLSGGGKTGAQAPRASFADLALRQQQHAAEIEMRKAELEERSSLWNKGLQVFDRVFDYRKFSKGLGLQRHSMDIAADQYKFTVDALGGTQRDAYSFGTTVLDRGSLILQVPEGSSASVIRLAD